VEAIVNLKKRWNEEAHLQRFYPSLTMTGGGLVLGAGTVLAPMIKDQFGIPALAVDGDEE
jgi:hypothetical protein